MTRRTTEPIKVVPVFGALVVVEPPSDPKSNLPSSDFSVSFPAFFIRILSFFSPCSFEELLSTDKSSTSSESRSKFFSSFSSFDNAVGLFSVSSEYTKDFGVTIQTWKLLEHELSSWNYVIIDNLTSENVMNKSVKNFMMIKNYPFDA